ncbi:AAA family ATPase [Massilicoli timonensis]|nr:AAA family ATPase [Massilicoli timonensis]
MGKIVMPKNSALLNEIESVLQIYYEADNWLPNDEYKAKLKLMIGDDQYSSSYTKKAQITSYFGFTIWEDINNPQSRRRITPSGKKMYEAIKAEDTAAVQEVLMNALETVKFGRDNYGCPESSSDVEPPSLYVRAILDMGYLTYREFAFLLWKLEDLGANYTDSLAELKVLRSKGTIDLGEEANKYADCKPIMILVRWGFLAEDTTDSSGGKHIIIAPEVLSKYETRLRNLKIYNIDMDCDEPITNDYLAFEEGETVLIDLDKAARIDNGTNVLLYGVPGSGKSWTIEHEYCKKGTNVERLVFHPDYTYSDFIGQILPNVAEDGQVSYKFTAGPFTNILADAYQNPDKEYILIIEEINRGNAPAIFGEVFQLLDRKTEIREVDDDGYPIGTSEYGITNANIAAIVYGDAKHKVRIPSNLSIIGTMNTSDQNVFTLDTAFQRRWEMRLIENNFEHVDRRLADAKILDTGITWEVFCTQINKIIVGNNARMTSAEDKRLGAYFVHLRDLAYNPSMGNLSDGEYDALRTKEQNKTITDAERDRLAEIRAAMKQNRKFPEKVIKYLWDDAFKFNREIVFETTTYQSLEQVIRTFMYAEKLDRLAMFKDNVRNAFTNPEE